MKRLRPPIVKMMLCWVGCAIMALCAYSYINNDYMTPQKYNVTVINKMLVAGAHGREHPTIVYRTGMGTVFDSTVSVSTYMTSDPGMKYTISRRPMDVSQTRMQNALYFFGPCLFLSIAIMWFAVMLVYTVAVAFRLAAEASCET